MSFSARSWVSSVAAGLAAIAASASLCDIAKADPLSPIWTGAYVGFHGGVNWSDVDFSNIGSANTNAFTLGGHAGYAMNFGNLIAGIEGDLNYDNSNFAYLVTPSGTTGTLDVNWNASLRGRVGVNVGPALLYATAGIAWTERTLVETTKAGNSASTSSLMTGVVYGVGAETFVLPNLSVRLEALRYDYGSQDISIAGAAAAIKEIDPSDTVVRAGVTFHLN